ncbi:MAG: tRNA-guanine transglycosylase [SAR324 cluster bacterium]|nr:tRNA-guanine transglycosylase [SAR324 cluster bacterium]
MDYRQDDFAVTYNTTLRLGEVPVLWAPVFAWPTVQKRRTGFLAPNLSTTTESKERLSTGTRISVPFFLSLGVDHDLTLTPEHYTARGTALRLGYRYAFVEDQKGRLKFWGIPETAPRNFSSENRDPASGLDGKDHTRNRFWSQWGHNQGFGGNTRFISDVAQASDGQVLREYERVREYRPSLDFQVSVSHQAAWGHGAVTAEHASEYTEESIFADGERFTDGGVRPQLLPRASYNGGVQFGRGLPLGLELAATVTRFLTDEGASGRAETAAPAISLPVRLIGSLEFRPTIERRFVRYAELDVAGEVFEEPAADRPAWLENAESLRSEEGFAQTETEFELRAPFARVFLPESGSWGALKHRVTPRLILREIEDVPQPLAGLLVRPEPALKLLTFRLDNALFGKRGEDSAALPKKIATLNLIQRYNLLLEDEDFVPDGPPLPSEGETEPGEPLLPAILEGSYSGTGYDLSAFLRYHHQLDRIVEYRLGLGGSVSPRGRLRLTYTENVLRYRTPDAKLHPAVNTLRLNGALTAHDDLSFTFNGTVNLRNARHADDARPLDEASDCSASRDYSRAYLHHLVMAKEILGAMLLSWHNLHYYQDLMADLRRAVNEGALAAFEAAFRAEQKAGGDKG